MDTLFNQSLTSREINILRSPKQLGNSDIDSKKYLDELHLRIKDKKQAIQFSPNINEEIHRWAPYVQGFSASFVQSIFDEYSTTYHNPVILDPFSGCGTVQVQAKLNGYESFGTELNPLLHFISRAKLNCWNVRPAKLINTYKNLKESGEAVPPPFLKSTKHFEKNVLRRLLKIKASIDTLNGKSQEGIEIKDLLRLAFSSILIDCSNLKRSPCLGYARNKIVTASTPRVLMDQKVQMIANDLGIIQRDYKEFIQVFSQVTLANAMEYLHTRKYDLVITSPPYMNGMDYVINYKIEMGWLGFALNQSDLKRLKDDMVVCDNVSKGLIRKFRPIYTNDWIEEIKNAIGTNIGRRGSYRRLDMPYIVQKYFDDMYGVMKHVIWAIKPGGRFILVVGDSLIADVYVPTDLLIARIGQDLGMKIEKVEKARNRRSGQIRSYQLRETIITLLKV